LPETRKRESVQCAVAVESPRYRPDECGRTTELGNFFRGGREFLPTRHAENDDLRGEDRASRASGSGTLTAKNGRHFLDGARFIARCYLRLPARFAPDARKCLA